MKFRLDEGGNGVPCHGSADSCPVGGPHYDSVEEAQADHDALNQTVELDELTVRRFAKDGSHRTFRGQSWPADALNAVLEHEETYDWSREREGYRDLAEADPRVQWVTAYYDLSYWEIAFAATLNVAASGRQELGFIEMPTSKTTDPAAEICLEVFRWHVLDDERSHREFNEGTSSRILFQQLQAYNVEGEWEDWIEQELSFVRSLKLYGFRQACERLMYLDAKCWTPTAPFYSWLDKTSDFDLGKLDLTDEDWNWTYANRLVEQYMREEIGNSVELLELAESAAELAASGEPTAALELLHTVDRPGPKATLGDILLRPVSRLPIETDNRLWNAVDGDSLTINQICAAAENYEAKWSGDYKLHYTWKLAGLTLTEWLGVQRIAKDIPFNTLVEMSGSWTERYQEVLAEDWLAVEKVAREHDMADLSIAAKRSLFKS